MSSAKAVRAPAGAGLAAVRTPALLSFGWYPSLIGLLYVVGPLVRYDVSPMSGARAALVAMVVGLSLTVLLSRLTDRYRGAALAAVIVMGLVAVTTVPRALVFVAAFVLILVERRWSQHGMRLRVPWARITEGLNILLAVLLALQVAQGVMLRLNTPRMDVPAAWTLPALPADAPDIFIILPDGRGRSDVMRDGYGLEQDELAARLPALGFTESPASHANHAITRFSLPVLLTGRPLEELGQDMTRPAEWTLPATSLGTGGLPGVLGDGGYEAVIIASGFEHFGIVGGSRFIDVGPRNEVEQALIDGSGLGSAADWALGLRLSALRARTLGEFDVLQGLAEVPGRPIFVLAHLPVPHPPFAFNADCSPRPQDATSYGTYSRGSYRGDAASIAATREQTMCVDHLIAESVEGLVATRPEAVIIVLSDHGPEERLDWYEPDQTGVADRMANVFWARTPGREGLFPEDVTLVNVLPILFNAYLGTDLPLHANDLWFGPTPSNDHLVRYTPVEP